MSLVRRTLSACAVVVMAAAGLVGGAGSASASALPQSPYCVTVDGNGVCLILETTIDHMPDPVLKDYTAAVTVKVGFACAGTIWNTSFCNAIGGIAPITIGRTGVANPSVAIGTWNVATVRIPEVCVVGTCVGNTYVPITIPWVFASTEIWVDGGQPAISCNICQDLPPIG